MFKNTMKFLNDTQTYLLSLSSAGRYVFIFKMTAYILLQLACAYNTKVLTPVLSYDVAFGSDVT